MTLTPIQRMGGSSPLLVNAWRTGAISDTAIESVDAAKNAGEVARDAYEPHPQIERDLGVPHIRL